MDEQIEDLFKSKRSVKDKLEGPEGANPPPQLPPTQLPDGSATGAPPLANANTLQATNMANKIKMVKEEKNITSNIFKKSLT